ncbi:hypothetical protein GOV05_00215 [Candidatus Woesearchaeota archaeon]|nr:hypothetical protein [Candidatus Woesearchaeota archaeon]
MEVSKSKKLFFWVILGSLSVLFAEVIAGSSAYPFFTAWGLLVVFPLYALHTVFFFYIIYTYGKPTLPVLYTAGMLFGMYEAYMTKVVWTSYIDTGPILSLGGIAVFETLLLVLVWHSILAFMVPLFIAETHLTKSKNIISLLPEKIRKHGKTLFIVLLVFGGLFTSLNSPNLVHSLTSTLFSGGVVLLLMFSWKKKGYDKYSIEDLLPSKKAFKTITSLLIALYLVLLFIIKFDSIPGFLPQLIVWVVYALLIWLLVKNLAKSRKAKISTVSYKEITTKNSLLYLGLFVLSALIGEILKIEIIMILASFLLIAFPGIPLLAHSIRN